MLFLTWLNGQDKVYDPTLEQRTNRDEMPIMCNAHSSQWIKNRPRRTAVLAHVTNNLTSPPQYYNGPGPHPLKSMYYFELFFVSTLMCAYDFPLLPRFIIGVSVGRPREYMQYQWYKKFGSHVLPATHEVFLSLDINPFHE